MNRISLIIVLLFICIFCNAQKYYTRSGLTEFKASQIAFEPVEAINENTTVIFNINSGEVVAHVFIASFEFKNALMQEHFNENYMQSNLYPKGIFNGKINNFSKEKLNTISEFDLSGILTIREKEKNIKTKVKLKEVNNKIIVTSKFIIKPDYFDIKIPYVVREKIANQIQITLNYKLDEKK